MTLEEFFKEQGSQNVVKFCPVGRPHPIPVVAGRDAEGRLLVSFYKVPEKRVFRRSRAIEVKLRKDDAGNQIVDAISVSGEYDSMFIKAFQDILEEAAGEEDPVRWMRRIVSRYELWLRFWSRGRKGLENEEKQGLYGELVYLEHLIDKGVDPEDAISSWRGPAKAEQDFIRPGFWAEVKTVKASASTVSISSLEQLDNPLRSTQGEKSKIDGRLVLVVLNLQAAAKPLSLGQLIERIRLKLREAGHAEAGFMNNLELIGWDPAVDEAADPFIAELVELKQYSVNEEGFPKITRSMVPTAVENLSYRLSIQALDQLRKSGGDCEQGF